MNRTWKNVICVGAMVLLAGGAVATGMDIFGSRGQEMRPSYEERDWSFGGYDDDLDFFQGESRGRGFEFEEGWSSDSDTDAQSGATEDSGSASSRKRQSEETTETPGSSEKSEKTEKSDQASTQAAAMNVTPVAWNTGERRGGLMVQDSHRSSVNGYGVFVFILELLGIALLAAWMIVSRGNKRSWKEVFSRTQTLPSLPETPENQPVVQETVMTEAEEQGPVEETVEETGQETVTMDPATVVSGETETGTDKPETTMDPSVPEKTETDEKPAE